MNHDPFKINEAILDLWRDLKSGEDYIDRLEARNAELISENHSLKAEVERLRNAGDAIDQAFKEQPTSLYLIVEALRRWNAAKDGKPTE